MKRFFSALAAISAALAIAHAEDKPLSFTWGAITHYRDRHSAHAHVQPALQSGEEDALPGGFHSGTGDIWPSKKTF